ncbi:hypothetical protein [Cupriavidus consociatus]|uniref:hypothetical protein n=1 Tax=Cupriavidus consociatus TaxID=2821357 RepID=UPI001AE628BD|nr:MULTISPECIES: hypothetical protein [unclassified Cupriavidus]MBP0618556.1 hypothetical protein [Cupriavidus sp. LEh25]MDK2655192.1 hypothetical protein [Cupriavidus sp. LEh21]
MDTSVSRISPTDLLHYIRAKRREIRSGTDTRGEPGDRAARCLSEQLRHALTIGSPVDIAVLLGCAAEMSMFPLTPVLEQCTAAIRLANQPALRGLLWAVRHRQSRAPACARRLLL